jgi:hypothetical protein
MGWLTALYARLAPAYAWRAPKTIAHQPSIPDWEEYEHPPFSEKVLIDGSTFKGTGLLMRRLGPDGSWQHRLPTQDENYRNWVDSFI